LLLASLPSGFPRNPNVLLIRTHPNPSPSVANISDFQNVLQSLVQKSMMLSILLKLSPFQKFTISRVNTPNIKKK
jgi:hypothetical protein